MITTLESTQSFEERMMLRIKESIGNMITDDELKKIVEKGIEKAFFEQPAIKSDYGRIEYKESLALNAVKEFAKKKVDEAVTDWLKNNPDKILEMVDKVIRDGIVKIMSDSLEMKLSNAMYQLRNEVQSLIMK